MRRPISPATIFLNEDGRWTWYDIDVTDHPFWWKCGECGHDYQQSIAVKIAVADAGGNCCPACTS